MPKIFGREMPPVVIGGAGLVAAYLVYTTLFPAPAAPTAGRKAKPAIKKSGSETDYLDTDYSFQVATLPDSTPVKDAFKPLVVKNSLGGSNGIPSIDNYTYSGMAQLNGVANGLLENGQTGQGDFVQPGEHWHDQVVIKVTPDLIELRNENGDITQMLAGAASAKSGASPVAVTAASGGNNPVMVGPIGSSDISVQPDAAPVQAQGPGQGNGRRRGRRRGGGGGGVGAAQADGG